MKKEDIGLTFALGIFLLAGIFLCNMSVVYGTGAEPGVSLDVGNSAPTIEGIGASFSEDPDYCTTTTVNALWFNVSDSNGVDDINIGNCYINYTYGATTHQATSCSIISNGTTWANISCDGATLDFYDTTGDWNITFYAEDDSAEGVSNMTPTTNLTYNTAFHSNISAGTVTFGSVTINVLTENTNSPDLYVRNCGNGAVDVNWTGANITDGDSNSIPATAFVIDNSTGGLGEYNMTLSEDSQQFTPLDNLVAGATSNRTIYFYVTAPLGTPTATYSTGTWTMTASEHS